MPVSDETYIKVKVRECDGKIKTNFWGDGVPKQNMHYTCIACITIDSVMKMDKKNNPQVYLEECKHRVKKCRCLDSEAESKSDTELMAKLESGSGSDSE